MEAYAAAVDAMDQGVGRIVKTLKESNELDNTLILFLADNGGCAENLGPGEGAANYWLKILGCGKQTTRDGRPVRFGNDPSIIPGADDTYASYCGSWANLSNTPFRKFKSWIHEGGIATPLIAHWPNKIKAKGELRHQPGQLTDVMATLVDLAEANYPTEHEGNNIPPMEGVSLVPAFDNKPTKSEGLYWEHIGCRGVRVGDWKLVCGRNAPWELFNITEDRTELKDLSSEMPAKARELEDAWYEWAYRVKVLPKSLPKPKIEK